MKKWFDVGTNLVVIAMAVALVLTFFHYRLAPWQLPPTTAQVQVGDILPPLDGVDFAKARETLLVVMQDGCHFCEDSMPFYRKLQGLEGPQLSVPIVAVLPNSASVAKKFVSSHGLAVHVVPNVKLSFLKVSGTPTMILADAKRRVTQVWVGEQSTAADAGIVAELEFLSERDGARGCESGVSVGQSAGQSDGCAGGFGERKSDSK